MTIVRAVGLDFGTTNSAIGVVEGDSVRLAKFPHAQGTTETFRSLLYFHPDARDASGKQEAIGGPRAIDKYLESEGRGRLVQSMKSYLADRGFQATNIFGRTQSLVDLLAALLLDLRMRAEEDLGPLGSKIVCGRPVKFAHADKPEDEIFALDRLRQALGKAGWTDVTFEHEPVGAAYYYERQLEEDKLVLIADFGGGTSDFTLIDVGPSRKKRANPASAILGSDGVGLAGDALDAKMLHNVVAPRLGLGSTYKAMFGRELEVPVWIYARLRRWHHLSFLKTKKNTELLEEIASQSADRSKIEALIHILDNDLGYHLYRAIERTKVELSSKEETKFHFEDSPLLIESTIRRADFEGWISEETNAMAAAVDRLLASTGIPADSVDQVFMTGGTSFVPAVRKIFDDRFGHAKIHAGGEMISVATGLALMASER